MSNKDFQAAMNGHIVNILFKYGRTSEPQNLIVLIAELVLKIHNYPFGIHDVVEYPSCSNSANSIL